MRTQSSSVLSSRSIKRNLVGAYLRAAATTKGIRWDSLHRVRDYLDIKFGLAPIDSGPALFPDLRPQSVYDPGEFDWVQKIEDNAQAIQSEFFALRERGLLKPHPQKLLDSGSWNTYYFYSNGLRFDEHCDACPITSGIIDSIEGAGQAGQAYFSVMGAGTHVKAHRGPTNTRIRCHLGLIVPETAVIRVESEMLHWRDLGCIVFDDSFDHEVWNPDSERAVMILDLWHPDLTADERWALQTVSRLSRRNRAYRQDIKTNR